MPPSLFREFINIQFQVEFGLLRLPLQMKDTSLSSLKQNNFQKKNNPLDISITFLMSQEILQFFLEILKLFYLFIYLFIPLFFNFQFLRKSGAAVNFTFFTSCFLCNTDKSKSNPENIDEIAISNGKNCKNQKL